MSGESDDDEKAQLMKSNAQLRDHVARLKTQLEEMIQRGHATPATAQVVAPAGSWGAASAIPYAGDFRLDGNGVSSAEHRNNAVDDNEPAVMLAGPGLNKASTSTEAATTPENDTVSTVAASKYTDVIRRLQMEIVKKDSEIEQLKAQLLQAQLRENGNSAVTADCQQPAESLTGPTAAATNTESGLPTPQQGGDSQALDQVLQSLMSVPGFCEKFMAMADK